MVVVPLGDELLAGFGPKKTDPHSKGSVIDANGCLLDFVTVRAPARAHESAASERAIRLSFTKVKANDDDEEEGEEDNDGDICVAI